MERYLINCLKNNSEDDLTRKYIDFFKIELDWFIYNYGDHMSKTHNRTNNDPFKKRINNFIQSYSPTAVSHIINAECKNILSSLNLGDNAYKTLGVTAYSSIFQPVGRKRIIKDYNSIKLIHRIKNAIKKGTFTDLYNYSLFYELENHQQSLIEQYRKYNFRGLCLFSDQYFESKYLIDIFKKLQVPSFVFSHGLPALYSKDVDYRSDYLMVWGEKIKENYVRLAGRDPNSIKVIGNVKYSEIPHNISLKNSFEDILVIPISSVVWHQHEWGLPNLVDRSMIVNYLYQVQHVLQLLGVKRARFRPHPSINSKWVYGFLDKEFYYLDTEILQESLSHTSLVIGATSTTFLETLMNGVNYVIFEPQDENGINLLRTHNVPPFDGSVNNLEIAKNEDELYYLLKSNYISDPRVLEGYLQPFDISVMKRYLK